MASRRIYTALFCIFMALVTWRVVRVMKKDIAIRKSIADKHIKDWWDIRTISVYRDQGLNDTYYRMHLTD